MFIVKAWIGIGPFEAKSTSKHRVDLLIPATRGLFRALHRLFEFCNEVQLLQLIHIFQAKLIDVYLVELHTSRNFNVNILLNFAVQEGRRGVHLVEFQVLICNGAA